MRWRQIAGRSWAAGRTVMTVLGTQPWKVVTLSEWFDPKATIESDPTAFGPRAYTGAGPVVGYDLGRFFGLTAEHFTTRTGTARDGWTTYPPGWGKVGSKSRIVRVSPHRPPLYLKARRAGWQVQFAFPKQGHGKMVDGHYWRGEFIDLASLCYALDADRGGGFADHRRHFGLEPATLPVAVKVGTIGADLVAATVGHIWELALAADEEVGRWFTSPTDRAQKVCRISHARIASPASLAQSLLALCRLTPPLAEFDLSEDEHLHWSEAFHGGWAEAEPALLGLPLSVVGADVSSCFPLTAHLLGWWDLLTADRLGREDVTEELRRLCEKVATDPTVALSPPVWERFGFTLAEVRPGGERFMVEVEEERRPDGRTECVPLTTTEGSAWYSWPDVVAAAVLSGRAPEVLSAVRLVPEGRQANLRRRPFLSGLVLNLDQDPVPAIVGRRRAAKARGEKRLASTLHAMVNSLVSGNPSRLDPTWQKTSSGWRREETPGPWTFMPMAVSVQAGAHLLLATVERLVTDLGGCIAYRDTDSSFVPASPAGGTLPDGRRILTWDEVDDVLKAFDPLVHPGWPVWKTDRGTAEAPLQTLIFGPKRHIEFVETPDGPSLVDFTEANLGGQFVEPPIMPERGDDGHYEWAQAVALREVRYALAKRYDPKEAGRKALPWAEDDDFPSLRRMPVTTPQTLAALPVSLGARPASRYLAATPYYRRGHEAITLDRGDDLSGWRRLRWVDRTSGERAAVVLVGEPIFLRAPGSDHGMEAERLSDRASDWAKPPQQTPITEVTLDPLLVQHVGRVSGVLDAADFGLPGRLAAHRPQYDDAERMVAVHHWAGVMGARAFQRTTGLPLKVAARAAGGQPINARNLAKALKALRINDGTFPTCALDDCQHPVYRGGARFCNCRDHPSHQHVAEMRRLRAKKKSAKAAF
jgi:hypothetical protein